MSKSGIKKPGTKPGFYEASFKSSLLLKQAVNRFNHCISGDAEVLHEVGNRRGFTKGVHADDGAV